MNKAEKTRMLMESFNKAMNENNPTVAPSQWVSEIPMQHQRSGKELESTMEEVTLLNGEYIEQAEMYIYYDISGGYDETGSYTDIDIHHIWIESEDGKYLEVTKLVDDKYLEYCDKMIEEYEYDKGESERPEYSRDMDW